MTTNVTSTAIVVADPAFSDPERFALAGFLVGYGGLTAAVLGVCRSRRHDAVPPAQVLDDLRQDAKGERSFHPIALHPVHDEVVNRLPANLVEQGRLPDTRLA